MGMFDNVICNYPLGDDYLPSTGWQTKDMDCGLDTYTIHEDGSLTLNRFDHEEAVTGAVEERQDYTGEIRFYTHLGADYTKRFTFRARFDHGALVELAQIEPEHKTINVDSLSAAQQRMALKDSVDHLLKKDTMAVKWRIWGVHNAMKHEDRIVYIEVRDRPEGRGYAVTCDNVVLSKDGKWEYEPMPSSRTAEFIESTRYKSFDEAFNQFKKVTGRHAL